MKRLIYLAVLLTVSVALASSCDKDPRTLDGSSWTVTRYEDLFAGTVVNSRNMDGTIDAFYENGYLDLQIRTFGWDQGYWFEDGEYSIVKSTGQDFVIDLFYVEYDDVDRNLLEVVDTFHGKKIYHEVYEGQDYYYYFLPNGHAVDLGFEDDYYYDTTRLYSKRAAGGYY